ncbi:MAG: hypothetical protein JWP42_1367, partial [Pseudomonas sp.]|nr:hypothetical protein [Pseudomonas sp.]
FNSPDSWSPFGKGGLNAYAYCSGDPVNSSDSSGHVSVHFVQFDKVFKSTFQLISNRKVFRAGHFAFAKKELINDFGGKKKLLQLANATGQNPDAIIVKALAERSHPKRLASFLDGNDVYTHVQKFDKYISQLAARRNINHELLKNPTYSDYLTPGELNNLKISQRNIKKELYYSIAESVKLRSPGPNTADFNVEMWNAAIRKSGK